MSTGVTYALVAAIEDYNQPQHFKKVKYAVKDAEELMKALEAVGVDNGNILPLLKEKATQTAIKQEIIRISRNALEGDRIIFYFSGHGAFDSGENYLLPVDCYNEDISGTGVSINFIMGTLKKSLCRRNILFLDSCHSGFEPGDDTKSLDKRFLGDMLVYNSRGEEYTVGFGSCKSNQTSITHPKLQHSVWTYFLIKALKGEASGIYEHGLLFSDKLQTYLKEETKEFVKLNTVDKKDQVPIVFGNQTDKFLIVDLNPLFEERERAKQVEEISFTDVVILRQEDGKVKTLPGFLKRVHTVPASKNTTTDGFIKKIGSSIVDEEISSLSKEIRAVLKYKLKEVQVNVGDGSGSIDTPDFTFSMEIKHSASDPSEYILVRKLTNFRSSSMILTEDFNKIFSGYFNELKFALSKQIDIEKFIKSFEDLETVGNIKIDYDPSDLTYCKLDIDGIDQEIIITPRSLKIVSNYRTAPQNLINAYTETYGFLLANPDLKLLE